MKTKQSRKGFTLIEVLFVLTVAGLILLLVFQGIPAFMRTSRNNERKQDISVALQAVSSFMLRNSANFPDDCAEGLFYAELTYYDKCNDITFGDGRLDKSSILNPVTDPDKAKIVHHAKCTPDPSMGGTFIGADYRNIIALYAVETSSGSSPMCQAM